MRGPAPAAAADPLPARALRARHRGAPSQRRKPFTFEVRGPVRQCLDIPDFPALTPGAPSQTTRHPRALLRLESSVFVTELGTDPQPPPDPRLPPPRGWRAAPLPSGGAGAWIGASPFPGLSGRSACGFPPTEAPRVLTFS